MLSQADPQDVGLISPSHQVQEATSLLTRKMWLPKTIYDALPWFYLFAGIAAFMATLYINAWFWILPHYVLFSAGCLHLGIIVLRRRRRAESALDDEQTNT